METSREGGGLVLDEGRASWDFNRILFLPPLLTSCLRGKCGMFGFSSPSHGTMKYVCLIKVVNCDNF